MVPFQGDWTSTIRTPPGAMGTEPDGTIVSGMNLVGPGYFELMGIEIVRGRPLDGRDELGSPPVIVINEALAQALWPGQDALGKTLPLRSEIDFAVVGVARNATYYELGEAPRAQTYGAELQLLAPDLTFLIETDGTGADLARAVQSALREVEPNLAFLQVSSLETVLDDVIARYGVTAILVGTFGALALLLAATGLYGLVSFLVAGRTREIGVRMALGVARRRVAAEVVGRALTLTTAGVALGLIGALTARPFTASLLYGITPNDPVPLVVGSAILVLVAALAALAPARRAMRVSPMDSLRAE
jgi:hypothetical protein